jgi:hypothetical protein
LLETASEALDVPGTSRDETLPSNKDSLHRRGKLVTKTARILWHCPGHMQRHVYSGERTSNDSTGHLCSRRRLGSRERTQGFMAPALTAQPEPRHPLLPGTVTSQLIGEVRRRVTWSARAWPRILGKPSRVRCERAAVRNVTRICRRLAPAGHNICEPRLCGRAVSTDLCGLEPHERGIWSIFSSTMCKDKELPTWSHT